MRSLLAVPVLAVASFAQDPADDVLSALLRDQPAAAARAAANAATPALRARLQAALRPAPARAAAMLAVAQAFPADAEADRALVAGAAAALAAANRQPAVPELAAWSPIDDDRDTDAEAMAPVVLGLTAAVAARRRAGGDAQLLQEAERLLGLARVTRFGLSPVRVPTTAAWQRPPELQEALDLRLVPCAPGRLPWPELDALGAPLWTATLPATGPFALPALPAGDWLLAAQSTTTTWRGVRRVLVSDLEAIGLEQEGWLALATFVGSDPVPATWSWQQQGAPIASGELAATASLVPPPAALDFARDCELLLRSAHGSSWLHHRLWRDHDDGARWLAHTMVDRPIYRPGETVSGRIVLRTCSWQGEGISQVPSTAPADAVQATVVLRIESIGELRQPLRTDADGLAAFTFRVPQEAAPGDELSFWLELPAVAAEQEPERLHLGALADVASFRRQAVQIEIDGPLTVAATAAEVAVTVRATWASGGAAAGLDVRAQINARDGWEREEAVQLQTAADGRATVRVPIASVGPSWVDVDFVVTGPDGKAALGWHRMRVVNEPSAADTTTDQQPAAAVPAVELGDAVVGTTCRIRLRGATGVPVLVVVGRGAHARLHTVQLAADGSLTIDEPVRRDDWPRFDVTVATSAGTDRATVPVSLRVLPELRLEVPAQASPGQQTTVHAHGDPGALVTFAVVDERIYELAHDHTEQPADALRPNLPYTGWRPFAAPFCSTPMELVRSLLVHGRVPELGWTRDLAERGSSGAGSAAPVSAGGAARTRFCPTAHFATVRADAHGDAATSFRLPDDLTRWRVTAALVTADGSGTITRAEFASRQPLAAEPVLPRALRAGDRFELPVAIDRAAAAGGAETVRVTAAATGEGLRIDQPSSEVAVAAGSVHTTTIPMRAVTAGPATLQLTAACGEFGDRSERLLPVAADQVVRTLAAAASGTGEVTVPLPAEASPELAVTVDVLQGGAAAWTQLAADLARYPYGCAEQTLSRLVPYFALVRAAKRRGTVPPVMDAAFGTRLRAGLAHLRTLQPTSSRQFAFWPDQDPEPGITGLVLQGLAMLRDGGFDLDPSGLDLPPYYFFDGLPRQQGLHVVDAAFVREAERLVGAARLFRERSGVHELLQPLLDLLPQLPAGLVARLGLALHELGDADGARACRGRLGDGTPPALHLDDFPGEDPLAVQALRLELDFALSAPPAALERAAAELLLACLAGRGTTYGHASALAALALVLPETTATPGTIVVEAGSERREFVIGGPAGPAVHCRLPHAAAVTVRGPAGMPLLVRITSGRIERASDHVAWATPIRVQRQWCTSRASATWRERREGTDLEPVLGALPTGRPLVLRLELSSPVPARHVVVDCPLPAGFELPSELDAIERFDDRVAFVTDLDPAQPTVLRLDVVPTLAGRFVWPPTTATPMYATEHDGGTAGAFVEVVTLPSGAVPSVGTCLQGPRPEVLDEPEDPLDPWCCAFRDAFREDHEPERGITVHLFANTAESWQRPPTWGENGPDEATRAGLIEALWAKLPPAGAEPWPRLAAITDLLEGCAADADDDRWAERAWRAAARLRLQALLVAALPAALASPLPKDADPAGERVRLLRRAIAAAAPADETLLARWWQLARGIDTPIDALLEELQAPPQLPALRVVLREAAATARADLFAQIWNLLDHADQDLLPPGLVLDRAPPDTDGVIAWAARSDAGCAELQRRLQTPEFVLLRFEQLERELPAVFWADVPLRAFAGLATNTIAEANGLTVEAVLPHLDLATRPTTVLQQELAQARIPSWRFLLATALRARGARAGTGAATTAAAPWAQALDLDADDVAGAHTLLVAELARRGTADLTGELDLLTRFVSPAIVANGTPDQLYANREFLDDARWAAAWSRLPGPQRVALLGLFQKNLHDQFVPATAAEAEALWQFVQRSGDLDGPLDALQRSPAGVECLRRHLLAGDGGPLQAELRQAHADAFALDAATLLPHTDDPAKALMHRLQWLGLAGAFTPAEAALLRRCRLYRGL
ncbi:MAG: hypothetical protein JNN13_14885 [Planctomycetes bacterium]|nr:hypothetical protein [Planctomycetota bacterium]